MSYLAVHLFQDFAEFTLNRPHSALLDVQRLTNFPEDTLHCATCKSLCACQGALHPHGQLKGRVQSMYQASSVSLSQNSMKMQSAGLLPVLFMLQISTEQSLKDMLIMK